jgi:hypothetical protein
MSEATIYQCAERARAWAEAQAKQNRFAPDLNGLCAISSAYLCAELEAAGLRPKAVLAPGHCYVECDEFLVDVTATQFGHGKIEVRNSSEKQPFYWQGMSRHSSLKSLKRGLSYWPAKQRPAW